ncbi:hypothetical protein [Corynebacterium glyciniphilum]|uniref:hypothetical protein n=1 Tax=Corynebacterium glyciniphilum TaxID=1404244 RepID=UPI00264C73A0|nr:hypothetical protein [Corynebacterium glyciniphilum]MDN5684750.1 hypothetical protein [Corynebacterium glyciniphilum]
MRRITARRTLTATAAALILTAALTACGSDDASNTSDATPQPATTDADTTQAEDPNAEIRDLYNQALDGLSLENDRFTSDDAILYDGTGRFEYALADVDGDDAPELLASAVGATFSNAKVFTVTDGELVETDELFAYGAATAGGGRAALHTSANADGVFRSIGQSASGETWTNRWTLEGDRMVEDDAQWHYRIDQVPDDLAAEQVEVTWTPADDRSTLDRMGETDDAEDQVDGPNPDRPTPPEGDADEAPADTGGSLPQDDFASPDQTGTTCGTVDGVTVTAGSATSCGFAMNVAQQALQPGSWGPGVAPDATVTAPWGSTTVTASSPATGETYTLSCNSGTDAARASCTGGNNAEVRFEKSAQGGLMYLLG